MKNIANNVFDKLKNRKTSSKIKIYSLIFFWFTTAMFTGFIFIILMITKDIVSLIGLLKFEPAIFAFALFFGVSILFLPYIAIQYISIIAYRRKRVVISADEQERKKKKG